MSKIEPIIIVNHPSTRLENDCACPDVPFVLSSSLTDKVEEDCACPDTPFSSNRFGLSLSVDDTRRGQAHPTINQKPVRSDRPDRFRIAPQLYTAPLPHNFTLAFSPFSPSGPTVLNQPALKRLQEFSLPQLLEQAVDYTLAEGNLLILAGSKPVMKWGRPTTLTAWLHITNACNLDCAYCYVRKSNSRMPDEIGLKTIERITQTAVKNNFETVKLKYAGGEPALQFRLVQKLHAYAQELTTVKKLGFRAVVLSNGTLWTPEMARWLADAGVKLMISLDGIGAAHDAQRPTRNGQGSFAQIEHAVDHILLPAGIHPDISITITKRNALTAAETVAWAIKRSLPFSLNFYRENLLSANKADLSLEEQQIIEGLRRAYQVVEHYLPARPFLGGLLDRVQAEAHAHACGVGQSYLVFNHAGRLAQCQMRLDEGVTLADTDDALKLAARGPIPAVSVDDKAGCRDCLWRYRCAGGCPLETYRTMGRFDGPNPNCRIYTTLFPEALRLEGLRLMKMAGYLT